MTTPFRAKKWAARSIVVVVLLSGLLLSMNWIAERKRALEAFEQEYPSGSGAVWSVRGQKTGMLPRSLVERYSPFTQITALQVSHMHVVEVRMVTILRHFRKMRTVSFDQGLDSPVDFIAILEGLGDPSSLTSLLLFNVSIDDRVLPILSRCRSLTDLAMVPSNLTGEGFPVLPELRTIDFAYSPVNDAGLARMIVSPKLEMLKIKNVSVTKQGVLHALAIAAPTVRRLTIHETQLSLEEIEEIKLEARTIAPEIDFTVSTLKRQ
jgi:hypothetical protein